MGDRFEGKVIAITGGASGMGEATARRAADEGAAVAVVDVDTDKGSHVVSGIADAGGSAILVEADVSTDAGANAAIRETIGQFGGLDVLVNNAGVSGPSPGMAWDIDERTWDGVLDVNLKGVHLCTRYGVPELLRRGSGSIVITASIASQVVCASAPYMASKGGVAMYAKTLAIELAQHNIRVNAVGPGFMLTPMATGERDGLSPDQQRERLEGMAARVPMGRMGEAVEVAEAVLFLASDQASYITGQLLCVDGGYTAV